ncbi:MAG: BlaI/MecI/CopY family transcriptional regulator [Lachnospiraceae bacterium]|nr:BlaI/MecI/CopY family transcriptional regulator [Lachnospiraceae bacterium]
MEKKNAVSDAELEILEVLWEAGEALSANEIRTRLNERKDWERTTVLTLIRRLLDKEILLQEKREVYYYCPVLKREEYIRQETRSFVDKFFSGSSRNLAAALVSDEQLSKEEINELRDFFNRDI